MGSEMCIRDRPWVAGSKQQAQDTPQVKSSESAFIRVLISFSPHPYSLVGQSVCFETSPYPSSTLPQATYPRLLPLLSKVRHDIINVGLVPGSSVLCPCRSLIRCIVALMPRVPLHFHPGCNDSGRCPGPNVNSTWPGHTNVDGQNICACSNKRWSGIIGAMVVENKGFKGNGKQCRSHLR